MIDVERLVRESLERHEADVPTLDPLEVQTVTVRTRRRQLLNAIGAGLAALVVVVGVVSGMSALLRAEGRSPADVPTPSPTVAPEPGPANQTQGIFGLPPAGTQPSLPETGALVITVDNFSRPLHSSMYIYADGRVLSLAQTLDEYTDTGGWLEQRLSPTGVELLHSRLIKSGMFEENLAFEDVAEVTISVLNGDRLVRMQGSSGKGQLEATPEQTRAIERVTGILSDLEAWLPPEAWTDRQTRAFVPSRFTLTLDFGGIGLRTPDDPSELPPPADDLLRDAEFADNFGTCTLITTEEARAMSSELSSNNAFDAWGPRLERMHGAITFVIVGGTAPEAFPGKGFVYLRPVLPHVVDCR